MAANCVEEICNDDEPEVRPVVRDLGVDSTGCRRHRVQTPREHQQKAQGRRKQLNRLRIGLEGVRVRLVRGSVHPSMLHGIEARGLPPQRLRILRHMLARQIGLQPRGNADVLFQFHGKLEDPGLSIQLRQFKAVHKLVQAWPEHLRPWLEEETAVVRAP